MALEYRPEVDGLRAIAVVAVVLYHAQFTLAGTPLLPGGFLGVDVFFVISGYLISRIILSELAETSGFRFLHFYERRARRILPMLFATLLVVFPLGWFALLPSAFVETSWSALSAVFFGSNFFFYFATTEYGAQANLLHPLLHTWSLGVEEQFYLVFPLLAVFVHRARARETRAFAALAFASLVFAETMTRIDSDLNFYLLPSRMWELLTGTLLALFESNSVRAEPLQARSIVGERALSGLGLLAVVLPMAAYSDEVAHPGLSTVVPVAGTALLIRCLRADSLTRRLMTSAPFVGIGLISYSVYLWHFPIFAGLRNLSPDPPASHLLGGIVATFLLSVLSYRFIETPFRNPEVVGRPSLNRLLASCVVVLCALPIAVIIDRGEFVRAASVVGHLESYSFDNKALLLESRAFTREHAMPFTDDGRLNVLIVGNSHGRDLFNALLLNEDRFPALNFSRSRIELSCFAFESRARERFFSDERYRESDVVLVSTRYSHQTRCRRTDPRGWSDLAGLKELIATAQKDGKLIAISGNTVEFAGERGRLLSDFHVAAAKPVTAGDARELIETINHVYYRRRYSARRSVPALNAELEALAEANGVLYLDREDFLCADEPQACFALTPDGRKSFADEAHLTLAGAAFFGQRLAEIGWLAPLYERLEERAPVR